MGSESMQKTGLQFPRQNPSATSAVHEQIHSEVLDEVMHIVAKALAVESVKERVAGSIGDGASAPRYSALSELQRLTAERTLIDLTVLRATEGTTLKRIRHELL